MSHIKKGLMFGMLNNKLADSEKAIFFLFVENAT